MIAAGTASVTSPQLLGRLDRYVVRTRMHEVDLRDGTLHAFHYVLDAADPELNSRYLRALRIGRVHWYVVDLRTIAPSLAVDMPIAIERDRPGLVKFTLRGRYPVRGDLHQAVFEHRRVAGELAALQGDAA